jgi:hypothetical protein
MNFYESWRLQLSKPNADAMRSRPWWFYDRDVGLTTNPEPSGGSSNIGGRKKRRYKFDDFELNVIYFMSEFPANPPE